MHEREVVLPDGLVRRAADDRQASFELSEEVGGAFRLEIAGPLPPAWCGQLSAQCAAAGLGIREGRARRVAPGRWAGRFRIVPVDPATNVRGYDFARMARSPVRRWARPERVRLDGVGIAGPDGAGEVRLDVAGADAVGLLAWLIERCAALGLHPARLEVHTDGDRVRDTFWLVGVGGSAASATAAAALGEALGRHRRESR